MEINNPDFLDVFELSELPILPVGLRYFDFIGGSKNFRCFKVPENAPRNEFMERFEHLLDPCLAPIYKHSGIVVRQDASYALPGFYIVSPTIQYRAIDEMPEEDLIRMYWVVSKIRLGVRNVLGIKHAYVLYEEKANISCNVHIWILPIVDIDKFPRMYALDIKRYLEQFRIREYRKEILKGNALMRQFLDKQRLAARDQLLKRTLVAFSKEVADSDFI